MEELLRTHHQSCNASQFMISLISENYQFVSDFVERGERSYTLVETIDEKTATSSILWVCVMSELSLSHHQHIGVWEPMKGESKMGAITRVSVEMHQISDIMLNNVSLHGSTQAAPHQWAIGHAFVCSQLNIIEFHIAVCQYPVQCILYSNNPKWYFGK